MIFEQLNPISVSLNLIYVYFISIFLYTNAVYAINGMFMNVLANFKVKSIGKIIIPTAFLEMTSLVVSPSDFYPLKKY